ncbi:MAG: hypothetical protein IJ545_03250 [Alphaproteobacteria bacterium]|nr:hypothetical protein [Alphaproteobacteria bacterium]
MDLLTKQAMLSLIKENLAKLLCLPCSAVIENVGSVFFLSGMPFITFDQLKDKFDAVTQDCPHLPFSIIDLDTHRFIGNATCAKLLFEAFGGRYWKMGNISLWESAIYDHDVWTDLTFDEKAVAKNATPLDKEDVCTVLF